MTRHSSFSAIFDVFSLLSVLCYAARIHLSFKDIFILSFSHFYVCNCLYSLFFSFFLSKLVGQPSRIVVLMSRILLNGALSFSYFN